MRIKRPLVCKHSARAGTDLASFVRVSNMEGCRRQVRRTERFERARNTATRSAAKGDALKKNKKKLDKSEWGGGTIKLQFINI